MQTIIRLGLGLVFLASGLAGLLGLAGVLPTPAPSGAAAPFLDGLADAGYVMPLVKLVELGAGVLLLTGRAVPLALVLLAPIVINIVGFHAALAPEGLPIAAALAVAGGYLAWRERRAFAPLFVGLAPRRPAPSEVGVRGVRA